MSSIKGLLDEMKEDAEKEELSISINAENKNSRKEELQNPRKEDKLIKSGYRLKTTTLEKLNEMKVYMYPPRTTLESIVDEAICKLYDLKKQP